LERLVDRNGKSLDILVFEPGEDSFIQRVRGEKML
jgi:hypothetical protein